MTYGAPSLADRAIDAAADLAMTRPLDPPPGPAVSALCRRVGVGNSTFYRLFGDSEGFRSAVALRHIDESYAVGLEAVGEAMAAQQAEAASSEHVVPSSAPVDRAQLVLHLVRSFFVAVDGAAVAETLYAPWSDVPAIADAIAQTFDSTVEFYLPIGEAFLELTSSELTGCSLADVMRHVSSMSVAEEMVPLGSQWFAIDGQPAQLTAIVTADFVHAASRLIDE